MRGETDQPGDRRRTQRWRQWTGGVAIFLLFGLLQAPSCMTTSMWEDTSEVQIGEDEEGRPITRRDLSIWEKMLFTPFTVAFDILTAPIQSFFEDEDDDGTYQVRTDDDDDC